MSQTAVFFPPFFLEGKHDGDDDEDDSGTPMCRRKKTIPQSGFIYILIGFFVFFEIFL